MISISSSTPAISIIIPAHNSSLVITQTLYILGQLDLPVGSEIVVIENGSTDNTTEVLQSIKRDWKFDNNLLMGHSDKGFGAAANKGVDLSQNELLFITGDDLPFGTADLTHAMEIFRPNIVIIGSKLHPESNVVRSWSRRFQTQIFRFLRIVLLQTKVGDSQGNFLIEKRLLHDFLRVPRHTGFLWTTELVYYLEQSGIKILEIPVDYDSRLDIKSSSIRLSSSIGLFFDVFRIWVNSHSKNISNPD